jgi:flagellar hook capping protein FlgD
VISAPAGERARAARAATLARVALAVLVAAGVVAFFIAQAVKREAPLVNGHGGVTRFRPDGPGVREAHFHLKLSVGDVVEVSVLNAAGREVQVIARERRVREYQRFELVWNGTTAAGALATPGDYRVEVRLERTGRTVVVPNFQLVVKGRAS